MHHTRAATTHDLSKLGTDARFDVAVIGGGIQGSSAARHLAAAGYSVALFERRDFGEGSTSRSTRVLHCGLKFFDTGEPLLRLLAHPVFLARCLRVARRSMKARSELARTIPQRVRSFQCYLPVYTNDRFPAWQLDLGIKVLEAISPRGIPLEAHRVPLSEIGERPLLRWLRDRDQLSAVTSIREYYYFWGERMAVDNALDAADLGTCVFNYAEITALERGEDGTWHLEARSTRRPSERAFLRAAMVLNTAGIWVDPVNRLAGTRPRPRVKRTRGAHIVLRLPDECRSLGLINNMRDAMPAYLVPWCGTHHYGPTDVPFDGDPDDIRVTEDEVDFLLGELDYLLPGAKLTRTDVIGVWAGVRPWTNEIQPRAKSILDPVFHDMAADGMPGVFSLTGASIAAHRHAGRKIVEIAARRLKPSRAAKPVDYSRDFAPPLEASPELISNAHDVTVGQLKHSAANERVESLSDLLLRRIGLEYDTRKGTDLAERCAEAVADILGWDRDRVREEVAAHRQMVERLYQPIPRDT